MASQPLQRRCARFRRLGWQLLILGAMISPVACEKSDPPREAQPAETAAASEPVADAAKNTDKPKDTTTRSLEVEGRPRTHRSQPLTKLKKDEPSFLSRNLLTGPNSGFNGQAGKQFNGGQPGGVGALGFGGGFGGFGGGFGGGAGFNGGNVNRVGGGAAPVFDPNTPPDGRRVGEMDGERYEFLQDNPFKIARGTDALSTISTSVDTASYANCRARIHEGVLPKKDAVRIADFVNYFPYDYSPPKNADPVAFKLEMAPCPWQPKHYLLRVGLKAKVIDKDQMPPRNLVFLIDTSGSMNQPNRLPLVQDSLRLLVEQLSSRDRVSIVSYAGEAGLRLPPTPGNQKEKIIEVINDLSAHGSTNGEGGILVAYEQAEKTLLKDGINRVILATDGDFNVGVSDEAQLVRLIEQKRKTGVYLTVLGYGMGNLQDATLEKLAHHGNGHYAYIDTIDEAKKTFVEQGGALVTVAKDVKLQVEFNPAKVAGYRLIGYENRILSNEDFRNDAKDAGDMGSGHTCTALYQIVPAGEKVAVADTEALKYQTQPELTPAAKNGEWLTVRMRYKHPETDKASEVSDALPADGLAKEASKDLQLAGAAAAFGMILRDSEYRGTADFDKVVEWARPAIGLDKGGHRAEFVRIVEHAKAIAGKIRNE